MPQSPVAPTSTEPGLDGHVPPTAGPRPGEGDTIATHAGGDERSPAAKGRGDLPATADPAAATEPGAPGRPGIQTAGTEPEPEPELFESPAEPGLLEQQLAAAVSSLAARLDDALRLLDRQTAFVDQLHAENQRLRRGELRGAQLPLVRDLLRLGDDTDRLIRAAEETPAPDDLRIVRAALGEALRRNGVVDASPGPGAKLDARLHSVADVVPTTDPSIDRTVAEVLRPGYAWDDGTTIRVADVRVYKRSASTLAEGAPTDSTRKGI